MTLEELQIKLGLDHGGLASGMRRAQASVKEFGETFKGVAEHSRKAWHGILHGIAEESPLLASAMRIAMSPVTGALMTGLMLFRTVKEQLKDLGSFLTDLARGVDKPFADMLGMARTLEGQIRKIDDAWQKWERNVKPKDSISEQLERRLKLLRENNKEFDKNPVALRKQLELEFGLIASALKQEQDRTPQLRERAERLKGLSESEIARGLLEKYQIENKALLEQKERFQKQLDRAETPQSIGGLIDISAPPEAVQALRDKIRNYDRLIEKNNKSIDEETRIRTLNAQALEEAQHKYGLNLQSVKSLGGMADESLYALMRAGGPVEDNRTAQQIWIDKAQKKIDDFGKPSRDWLVAQEDAQWNWLHPNAQRNRLAPPLVPKTPEQSLQGIDNEMKELNKQIKEGVPVFAKPD